MGTEQQFNFSRGKLCLSMIVKNECAILTRLFDSVVPIIDSYCICDTGSTDNTIACIESYMKTVGIPGIVFSEPFKNFGYNRTVALDRAAEFGEYALLLDADMVLEIDACFSKQDLTCEAYTVKQSSGGLEYYNTRIVRTGIGVRCVGPTHEYYDIPGRTERLDTLKIRDIGDGGAKADKFERDVRLLTAALAEDPNNGRNHFYLANSYRDLGRMEDALRHYKKRIAIGGWIEEVFYACYEAGRCYRRLGDYPNAVYMWLEAYNRHPGRAESLYEVVKHYRESGRHTLAQVWLDIAKRIPYPTNDVLFIQKHVYTYLLDYEQTVLAHYTGRKLDHMRYLELIGQMEATGFAQNMISNYKFYVRHLEDLSGCSVLDFSDTLPVTVCGRTYTLKSSTPSIIAYDTMYWMSVRYVNYTIRPNGTYAFQYENDTIISNNVWLLLDTEFSVKLKHVFALPEDADGRYIGIEDVKLIRHGADVVFVGTMEDGGVLRIGHGTYDPTATELRAVAYPSPNQRGCEKNWAYFIDNHDERKIVYEWYPLTIYDASMSTCVKGAVPAFFRHVRGSSHGVSVGDERWFLCHLVDYGSPRTYYHIIVILDATGAYKRHSIAFKFTRSPIEYALGLVVESERIILSYSTNDSTSKLYVLSRDVFERELFST